MNKSEPCEYCMCSERIVGWIDPNTPKKRFVEQCYAQKGAPEVYCHGVEKLCKCGRYKSQK